MDGRAAPAPIPGFPSSRRPPAARAGCRGRRLRARRELGCRHRPDVTLTETLTLRVSPEEPSMLWVPWPRDRSWASSPSSPAGGCSPAGRAGDEAQRALRAPGCGASSFRACRHPGLSADITVTPCGHPLFLLKRGRNAAVAPDVWSWEVPRAELGSRSAGSDVGRTRPLCHPDDRSSVQHPCTLPSFLLPLLQRAP
jgi:hypothetical protein